MEGFLFWGISSIGRAVGLQPSGYGFESHIAPQIKGIITTTF